MIYRCNHYDDRFRCESPASHRLFAPDGGSVPGGNYCWAHGDEIRAEYREKLGEIWTLRAIWPDGSLQVGDPLRAGDDRVEVDGDSAENCALCHGSGFQIHQGRPEPCTACVTNPESMNDGD